MTEEYKRYTRVAVELLQTQNPVAILMLKKFLTFIPSLTDVKHILTAAVIELVDSSPAAICWLLEHSECLQPEVNVTQIVIRQLSGRLTNWGFIEGQDFYINAGQKIEVSEAAKLALFAQSQIFNIQNPLPIVDYLQN